MVVFIPRIRQRLRNLTSDSDRKQVIEASGLSLTSPSIRLILDMLYSLLCPEAFAIVGDLETFVRRVFIVLNAHQYTERVVLLHCLSVLLLLTHGLPREVGEWCDDSHPGTSSLAVFERRRRNHVQLQPEGFLVVYLPAAVLRDPLFDRHILPRHVAFH
ncbi:hypothetical protein IW262DRAFT_1396307 [Armillaria fumosa]|nr:hypothetical protein IW262DRAFT_1396307 [Armillaria fumosa]